MGRIYDASQESDDIFHDIVWSDVFVFDIDGTLTEPNQDILREHANILSKLSHEKKIIILTARDFQTVESHILRYLPKETNWGNWLIAGANGGQTAKYSGAGFCEYESIYEMPRDFRAKICSDFEMIKHSWAIPQLHAWANIEDRISNLTIVVVPRFCTDISTWEQSKISREERAAADPDKIIRSEIIRLLQAQNNEVAREYEWMISGATSIDIKSIGALKGHNLEKILTLAQYQGKKVVFFGDEITLWGDESIPRVLPDVMSVEVWLFHQTYSFLTPFLSHYETN